MDSQNPELKKTTESSTNVNKDSNINTSAEKDLNADSNFNTNNNSNADINTNKDSSTNVITDNVNENINNVNNDNLMIDKTANSTDTQTNTNNIVKEENNNSQFNILSLNSKTIESNLSKVSCTIPKNATPTDLKKLCYNYGTCKLLEGKKEGELNNGICIFDNIFCNSNNCYHSDGCANSYIKHAQPQYLRPCEKNPTVIFETCPSIGKISCTTRECTSNEQCLSGSCVNKICIANNDNPIHYCSNNGTDEFGHTTDIFSCRLFFYERCSKDSDCITRNCASIKGDNSDNLYCLETKVTFENVMACTITCAVVVITLLILHRIYRQAKRTKLY
jgi:hypothetical protein